MEQPPEQPASTPAKPLPPIPVVPASLTRTLTWAVPAAVIGSAVAVAIALLIKGNADWWAGYWPATGIAILGGIAAIAILSRAAGRPVDVAISVVMIAAGVRIGISAVGAAVAIKAFEAPMTPTALLVCGYYVATLVAETVIVSQAVQSAMVVRSDGPGQG
jgi:hypothetical protein